MQRNLNIAIASILALVFLVLGKLFFPKIAIVVGGIALVLMFGFLIVKMIMAMIYDSKNKDNG